MELYYLGWCVNVRASPEPRSVRSPAPSTHAHTFTHQPRSLHYKCLEISLMRGSSFSLPSAQGTQDENATSINEWSPGMKSGMKYALVKGYSKGRRR